MTDLRTRLIAGMARAIDPDAFTSPNINSYARERLRATQDSARALDVLAATLDAEGWQVVPKEALPEMVGAFWRVKNGARFEQEGPVDTSDYAAYRALRAASPNPLAAKAALTAALAPFSTIKEG